MKAFDIFTFIFMIFMYIFSCLLFLILPLSKISTIELTAGIVLIVITSGIMITYLSLNKWSVCPYCGAIISKRNYWFFWKHRALFCPGCNKLLVIKRSLPVWFKIFSPPIVFIISSIIFSLKNSFSETYGTIWFFILMLYVTSYLLLSIYYAKLDKDKVKII